MKSGSGLIGLVLSVGLLIVLLYFGMQSFISTDDNQESTHEQGMTAIEEAEEVKKIIETRYTQ